MKCIISIQQIGNFDIGIKFFGIVLLSKLFEVKNSNNAAWEEISNNRALLGILQFQCKEVLEF